jgi:hypothetical protein
MKTLRKILPVVLLFFAVQASAQKISGGIKGGYTTGSVKISGIPNSFVNTIKGNNITGYEAGLFMKMGIGPFYLKPELLMNHRSGEVDLESETNVSDQTVDFKITRLEVPVMFGLELIGPLAIEAGPVYNKVLSVTENFNNENVSIKQGGVAYRIGAMAELGRVGLGVHYQGLRINSDESSESNFSLPSELIFSLAIRLGKL